MVELTEETADILRDFIDEHDIGPDEEVFPMSDRNYRDDVKDAFSEAGVMINDGPDADQYRVSEGQSFESRHWLRHNRNTRIKKEHGSEKAQAAHGPREPADDGPLC